MSSARPGPRRPWKNASGSKNLVEALKRKKPDPETSRRLRAVQAMELADTPDARAAISAWVGGAHGHHLTEDAHAALERLANGVVRLEPVSDRQRWKH